MVDTTGAAPISSLAIPVTTEGTHTVYAVGANGSLASTTITYDSVAPTVSSAPLPAANAAGWNKTSPVTVSFSAADATSGSASIRYTTDGTDPTSSGTAVTYSGSFTAATTTTVRYVSTDAAGNKLDGRLPGDPDRHRGAGRLGRVELGDRRDPERRHRLLAWRRNRLVHADQHGHRRQPRGRRRAPRRR